MQALHRAETLLLTLALALAALALDIPAAAADPATGTVYALTNDFVKNEVVIYNRAADGGLSEAARVDTGGIGTSAFESSTGMLLLGSADGQSSPVDLGAAPTSSSRRMPAATTSRSFR